jgi:DNA-directed RNA polymerase subunit beta'
VIVGRLIPAGTGGAARDIKKIATQRDAAILEQKKKEENTLVSDDTKVGTNDIEEVKEI